jgi:hypothetical protein
VSVGMPDEQERTVEPFDRNNAGHRIKLKHVREDLEP